MGILSPTGTTRFCDLVLLRRGAVMSGHTRTCDASEPSPTSTQKSQPGPEDKVQVHLRCMQGEGHWDHKEQGCTRNKGCMQQAYCAMPGGGATRRAIGEGSQSHGTDRGGQPNQRGTYHYDVCHTQTGRGCRRGIDRPWCYHASADKLRGLRCLLRLIRCLGYEMPRVRLIRLPTTACLAGHDAGHDAECASS